MPTGLSYKTIKASSFTEFYAKLRKAKSEGWLLKGNMTKESDGNFYQVLEKYNFEYAARLQTVGCD